MKNHQVQKSYMMSAKLNPRNHKKSTEGGEIKKWKSFIL